MPTRNINAPPTPLPLLASQEEMIYHPTSRVIISAATEMTLTTKSKNQTVPAKRTLATPAFRNVTPQPKPKPSTGMKSVTFSRPLDDANSEAEQSERSRSRSPSESSLSSLDSETETEDIKIPKPVGEAGRPGRGGYNLEEQMAWEDQRVKSLKV